VKSKRTRPAAAVGSGILLSRVTGLARDVAVAAFLGTALAADAYWAAIKIPNIIRNLLGEGTLSAAFVPVYSDTLERDGKDSVRARRLAASVLGIVLATAALLSALGVLLAPWITRAILVSAGEETRSLTTSLVRILFPMSGVLIIGAWFLGVLNSHGKFFLPFAAPALWNLSQVGGLLLAARLGVTSLAHALAWSALAGSLVQVAVQLPAARRAAGTLRPAGGWRGRAVQRITRNTLPVISSQGIFQISTLVDIALATLVGTSAMAALGYSQRLVYLPISLFGISVAAASLPRMSREASAVALRPQLVNGFFQILFFVLPTAVYLLLFGDVVVRVVYERGQFSGGSTELVAAVLGAYALGLVAAASLKLFASGFHALQDTRTPMRIAAVAVSLGIAMSVALTLTMKERGYGVTSVIGLPLGGAVGAWLNLSLLWVFLSRRVGRLFDRQALRATIRIGLGSAAAAVGAALVRSYLTGRVPERGFAGGVVYLIATLVAGAVPYLLIVRRPPLVVPEGSHDVR
jgi:putative peptidoglycan lipid II flippase